MKLNKKISKFLVLGMLTNNIYFYSSANTLDNEIPGRYETLEGEYITIDDSMEGNLEEIEIFGNTVQDPNNLEYIQSVGDLYVDENGNSILDSQGRKQYKINIISNNKNLDYAFLNKDNPDTGWIYSGNGATPVEYDKIEGGFYTSNHKGFIYKNLKPNTLYTFSADLKLTGRLFNGNVYSVNFQLNNGVYGLSFPEHTDSWERKNVTIRSDEKGEIYFILYNGCYVKNASLEEGNLNSEYEMHKNVIETILLPTQLQKVGDVADRLYWDNSKGRYLIKKNITSIVLDGSEEWIDSSTTGFSTINDSDYITFHNILLFGKYPVDSGFVSNNFNYLRYDGGFRWTGDYEGISDGGGYNFIFIRINKSKLETPDVEGFKKWLNNNPTTVWYQLKIPKIIDTNITSELNIPTFKGKTHIYVNSENGINPVLKVTVDRLPRIAKNAIEEAENDSTSYNISLARMYVNMLPESLYKDQLQEQLSQVFSSDITLDRKSASSNLDVYVKSQNMLSISLDTNSITFDGYSGVDAMELRNAVNLTVNSSLPYDLNAYMPIEITNSDGSSIIDFNILNIKESSESTYQQFADTINKVVLKSDCAKGNGNIHNIDLKLDSNAAHKADVYKTVIKFEAEQK